MIEELDDLTLVYMYGAKNGRDSMKEEIERLRAALRTIGYGPPDEGDKLQLLNMFVETARAALCRTGLGAAPGRAYFRCLLTNLVSSNMSAWALPGRRAKSPISSKKSSGMTPAALRQTAKQKSSTN
jgi:hypothetical protein